MSKEVIQGYLKKEGGKEYLVLTPELQVEILPQPTDGTIRLTPSLNVSMKMFQEVMVSNIPRGVDIYDYRDWIVENLPKWKELAESGEFDDPYEAIAIMAKDFIEDKIEEQHIKCKQIIEKHLPDYAKCYLWYALGIDKFPLDRTEDGSIDGIRADHELKLEKQNL